MGRPCLVVYWHLQHCSTIERKHDIKAHTVVVVVIVTYNICNYMYNRAAIYIKLTLVKYKFTKPLVTLLHYRVHCTLTGHESENLKESSSTNATW